MPPNRSPAGAAHGAEQRRDAYDRRPLPVRLQTDLATHGIAVEEPLGERAIDDHHRRRTGPISTRERATLQQWDTKGREESGRYGDDPRVWNRLRPIVPNAADLHG